jgi:hypothetical protein
MGSWLSFKAGLESVSSFTKPFFNDFLSSTDKERQDFLSNLPLVSANHANYTQHTRQVLWRTLKAHLPAFQSSERTA